MKHTILTTSIALAALSLSAQALADANHEVRFQDSLYASHSTLQVSVSGKNGNVKSVGPSSVRVAPGKISSITFRDNGNADHTGAIVDFSITNATTGKYIGQVQVTHRWNGYAGWQTAVSTNITNPTVDADCGTNPKSCIGNRFVSDGDNKPIHLRFYK